MVAVADKLYVFVPATEWTYCGGVVIICAASVEEACNLGDTIVSDRFTRCRFVLTERVATDQYHQWILERTYQLAEPQEIGVHVDNWNHA